MGSWFSYVLLAVVVAVTVYLLIGLVKDIKNAKSRKSCKNNSSENLSSVEDTKKEL